jgi:formylglycine-generating enzyme required for sulfatase activity
VQVSPFWLAETPVTNQQYGLYLKAANATEPKYWRDREYNQPQQPVVGVNWHDAMAYCQWLSEVSGKHIVLPTEAQWEFAARGPDNRLYPWGDDEPNPSLAQYETGTLAPVGSKPEGRGPFGTLDQAGNVWEWCLDVWDTEAYKERGELTVDPRIGPERFDPPPAGGRVGRGGTINYLRALYLRSAFRFRFPAEYRYLDLGFRVAASPAST